MASLQVERSWSLWHRAWYWGLTALLLAVVCGSAISAEKLPKSATGSRGRQPAGRPEQSVRQSIPADFDEREAEEETAAANPSSRPLIRLSRGETEHDAKDVNPVESDPGSLPELWGPEGIANGLPLVSGFTVLAIVPSILMMTTCFVRFTIVLGLLRQALGAQQLPPNSVLAALCLFLTFLVMRPVWKQSYDEGIRPYTQPAAGETRPSLEEAALAAARPVRQFMSEQIERSGNSEAVWLLLEYQQGESPRDGHDSTGSVATYDDVGFPTLAAAYVLSELKVACVIGIQILLPFLVIDLVVALLLTTLGMVMVPPATIAFPFKLLLFVLIDGWMLTVGKLLASVGVSP